VKFCQFVANVYPHITIILIGWLLAPPINYSWLCARYKF